MSDRVGLAKNSYRVEFKPSEGIGRRSRNSVHQSVGTWRGEELLRLGLEGGLGYLGRERQDNHQQKLRFPQVQEVQHSSRQVGPGPNTTNPRGLEHVLPVRIGSG